MVGLRLYIGHKFKGYLAPPGEALTTVTTTKSRPVPSGEGTERVYCRLKNFDPIPRVKFSIQYARYMEIFVNTSQELVYT